MNYKARKALDRLRARVENNIPGVRKYHLIGISPNGVQGTYTWSDAIEESTFFTSDESRAFGAMVIVNDVTQTIAVVYDGLIFVPIDALVTAQDEDDDIPF